MKNEFTSVAILVLTSCCLQFLFSVGGIRHVADARGMLPLKKIVIWFPSTAGVSLVNLMKNTVIEREYYKVIHINLTMQCYNYTHRLNLALCSLNPSYFPLPFVEIKKWWQGTPGNEVKYIMVAAINYLRCPLSQQL